jgi:hypothetical protein
MSTLVTEKQAADMMCPMRLNSQYPGVPCGASRCMAWRWGVNSSPDDLAWHESKQKWEPKGYCGQAGRADE